MKIALAILILTIPVLPQCPLRLNQAPSVRGFKLGMAKDKALALFRHGNYIPPSYETNLPPDRFAGVVRVTPVFVNEVLSDITFTYDPTIVWDDSREFVASINRSLKLKYKWQYPNLDTAVLICRDFALYVSAGRNTLTLVSGQRSDANDQRKKEFRP